MSKKNRKKSYGMDPAFKRDTEKQHGHVLDFSGMPEEMRMSAKLIDLAEPFHDEEIEYTVLYDCAAIAWNECVREDHDKKTNLSLNNMFLNFENYRELIDIMKEGKRIMYPDDTESIRKVKLFYKGDDNISVNVAYDSDIKQKMKEMLDSLS